MAEFSLALKGLDGSEETVLYDTGSSTLRYPDGRRLDISKTGYAYHDDVSYPAVHAVSPKSHGIKSAAPTRLKVQLGLGCNYSCGYCSQANHKAEDAGTSTRDVAEFATKLGAITAEPERVELWGGEPLLYWKKIKEIVPAIRALWPKTQFTMVTNGSLLTDEMVDFFEQHSFLLAISHDGPAHKEERGADPFDDPAWVDLARRLYDRVGFQFNTVATKSCLDPTIQADWLRGKLDRDVTVNQEGVVNAHDAAHALTDEQLAELTMRVFLGLISGRLHGMPLTDMKLGLFYEGLAFGKPAAALNQKCQMDRPDFLAVDLKGNVLTCQNTGADGVHRIGTLDALDDVKLTTSLHWSHRPDCAGCPVLHLCAGSCMFLGPLEFAATCRNEYAYNKGILTAAVFFLTGRVIQTITRIDVKPRKRYIPLKFVGA